MQQISKQFRPHYLFSKPVSAVINENKMECAQSAPAVRNGKMRKGQINTHYSYCSVER
ncbi:unnamed protein product [Meloidogyne enterolobii]|uniref:Uncharacterized protein n=1 Tax=Meloidogyne enterolobii TaxID=390850 RepID=A0ACB1AC79_MELEN